MGQAGCGGSHNLKENMTQLDYHKLAKQYGLMETTEPPPCLTADGVKFQIGTGWSLYWAAWSDERNRYELRGLETDICEHKLEWMPELHGICWYVHSYSTGLPVVFLPVNQLFSTKAAIQRIIDYLVQERDEIQAEINRFTSQALAG